MCNHKKMMGRNVNPGLTEPIVFVRPCVPNLDEKSPELVLNCIPILGRAN